MKFHYDRGNASYQIQSYNQHSVTISNKVYMHSIIVMPEYLSEWGVNRFETLETEHFQRLCALRPEVILLGTGPQIRFPALKLLAPLMQAGIGVEIMSTPAACRTYMILMAENRLVMAALLFN